MTEDPYPDTAPALLVPATPSELLDPYVEELAGALVDVTALRAGFAAPAGERRARAMRGARLRIRAQIKEEAPKAIGPKRFTTDAAIAYGRAQGWKFIDRERYERPERDGLRPRHRDLELGADAKFETETDFVYIQGAGVGERAKHYERFLERGGPASARKQNARMLYLEFLRGEKEPLKKEWWA